MATEILRPKQGNFVPKSTAELKSPDKWARRRPHVVQYSSKPPFKDKRKGLKERVRDTLFGNASTVDVEVQEYSVDDTSAEEGALPPRAKSSNDKPNNTQQMTLCSNPSDFELSERLERLRLRRAGLASQSSRNASTHTGARSQTVTRIKPAPSLTGVSSSQCKSLEDMVQLIQSNRVKNIVVMCGAGISTASGIPDFRSPKTGLYANLKQYNIPSPESIFDLDYFEGNPKPFFTLAKELYPTGKYRPNYTHYFLRLLHEKKILLRVYSQNIDGLERLAGIPTQKLVEAHGTFFTSSCVRCSERYDSELIRKLICSDQIPRCRKNRCLGLIKPDIVFFGEDLQKRFYYYLKDFPQADMLLVMGTSLQVEPFAGIVNCARLMVPRLLFNSHAVGPFKRRRRANDVVVQGDIADQLRHAAEMLGWHDELVAIMAESEQNARVEMIKAFNNEDKTSLAAVGVIANNSSQHQKQSAEYTQSEPGIAILTSRLANQPLFKPKISVVPCVTNNHKSILTNNHKSYLKHANNSHANPSFQKTKAYRKKNLDFLLPRLNRKLLAFHAQTSLSRCDKNSSGTSKTSQQSGRDSSEQEEEEEEEEETSESDDSDE